jgi:hypothetical protein
MVHSHGWKTLYWTGGIAALLAVFVFRRNLSAEFIAFRGFGLFDVPTTLPISAAEWFAQLKNNWFVGLVLLNVFDLVEYALLGLIILATCVALWHTNRSVTLLATACGLAGVIVYFASNQAMTILSVSNQYAYTESEVHRENLLMAGESLLAINERGNVYLGLFLVLLAGLLLSVVMLRNAYFGKATALTGILANGIGLTYFIILPIAPGAIVFPFVLSAPFRMIWYLLIAWKLFKMGRDHDGTQGEVL